SSSRGCGTIDAGTAPDGADRTVAPYPTAATSLTSLESVVPPDRTGTSFEQPRRCPTEGGVVWGRVAARAG
ncbi:MAG: hypothetical protein ACRDTG_15920, partial [Pseudonocardiaceae bacterium]